MENNQLILALYPNSFGMGYVLCESPKELINYGIARVRPLSKDKYIKRLHHFVKQYRPTIILLRGYQKKDKRISKRVIKIIESFEKEAARLDLPIFMYSREDIKEVFKQFEASSKYTISKTITSWYPELQHRMPNIRKNTQSEHYQMGVFDVFSLMLTHHYLE